MISNGVSLIPIDRLKKIVDYSYAQMVVILYLEININTVMSRL